MKIRCNDRLQKLTQPAQFYKKPASVLCEKKDTDACLQQDIALPDIRSPEGKQEIVILKLIVLKLLF